MSRGGWAVVVVALAGCDDHLLGVGEYDQLACQRDPPLTYENFGRGFLEKNCNGCHSSLYVKDSQRSGAPLGVDFDTWAGIMEWAQDIYDQAVPGDPPLMPPAGPPSTSERDLLAEWMKCEVLPDSQEYVAPTGTPP